MKHHCCPLPHNESLGPTGCVKVPAELSLVKAGSSCNPGTRSSVNVHSVSVPWVGQAEHSGFLINLLKITFNGGKTHIILTIVAVFKCTVLYAY